MIHPVLLCSKVVIAKQFKVSLKSVVHWHKQGAPISKEGGTYRAELNALQAWLVSKNMRQR